MDIKKTFGIIIIAAGLLALLHNFEIVNVNSAFLISILLLAVGGASFYFYFRKERSLFLLIIGFVSFFWGVGMLSYELYLIPFRLKTNFFLLGIGLSFLAVYFRNPKQWWAILPGGFILVQFTVTIFDELFYLQNSISTFLFYLGVGLIFIYLYLIRDEKNKLSWAVYPGIAIILISLFQLYFTTNSDFIQILVGILLIFIGIAIVLFTRQKDTLEPALQSAGAEEPLASAEETAVRERFEPEKNAEEKTGKEEDKPE